MNKIIFMSLFLSTPIFVMQNKKIVITNELQRINCLSKLYIL